MKNKIIYILIGVLLLIIPFTYQFKTKVKDETGSTQEVIELKGDTTIEKKFISKYNGMKTVSIRFATFNNLNVKGEFEVIIEDMKSNNKIYSKTINMSNLKDNEYYIFKFKEQKKSKNREYKITIKVSEITEKNKIAIWGYENNKSIVLKNGKRINTDFTIMYDCKKNEPKLLLYFFIYIFTMGFVILLKEDKKS